MEFLFIHVAMCFTKIVKDRHFTIRKNQDFF